MAVKADPGGFPQRRVSDVPSVTANQMRDIQRLAQEDYGFDILQITENAGRACARLALDMLGGRGKGQVVVILAGGGNKGAAGLSGRTKPQQLGNLRGAGPCRRAERE